MWLALILYDHEGDFICLLELDESGVEEMDGILTESTDDVNLSDSELPIVES